MIRPLKDESLTTAPAAVLHLASNEESESVWQFVSDLDQSFVNGIVARFLRNFAGDIFGRLSLVVRKRWVRAVDAEEFNLQQLLVLHSFVQGGVAILFAVLPVRPCS